MMLKILQRGCRTLSWRQSPGVLLLPLLMLLLLLLPPVVLMLVLILLALVVPLSSWSPPLSLLLLLVLKVSVKRLDRWAIPTVSTTPPQFGPASNTPTLSPHVLSLIDGKLLHSRRKAEEEGKGAIIIGVAIAIFSRCVNALQVAFPLVLPSYALPLPYAEGPNKRDHLIFHSSRNKTNQLIRIVSSTAAVLLWPTLPIKSGIAENRARRTLVCNWYT